MRFALIGDHRDGIEFAQTLAASGRHELRLYSGSPAGRSQLQRAGLSPQFVGDLEEVLADPDIDAIIVASPTSQRAAHLRRAIQSEAHVLCVHPADPTPDIAYEAAMIQADTGRVLLPMLPMALHPGLVRLAEHARAEPLPRLIELELCSSEEVLLDGQDGRKPKPGLPGWDVLRLVGGEIVEIYAQSVQSALLPGVPLVVTGRFVNGILLQATYMPNEAQSSLRMSVVTGLVRRTLHFKDGWPGPAELTSTDHAESVQHYGPFHPWAAMLDRFEQAVEENLIRKPQPGQPNDACLTNTMPLLGWRDELRSLELDDAARRSAERGRSNLLDLQETSEESTFKGTMTLVGCSLVWLALIVLIVSAWYPLLAWLIVPLFGTFLILQALRWIVPRQGSGVRGQESVVRGQRSRVRDQGSASGG